MTLLLQSSFIKKIEEAQKDDPNYRNFKVQSQVDEGQIYSFVWIIPFWEQNLRAQRRNMMGTKIY